LLRKHSNGVFLLKNCYICRVLNKASTTIVSLFVLFSGIRAQNKNPADSVPFLNLDQCIVYALQHQPAIMQAATGTSIARKTNAINLSAWLPQVNLSAALTHYDQLPTSYSTNPLNPTGPLLTEKVGANNTLIPQLSATETIFSPGVLFAAQNAHLLVQQARQSEDSTKINLVATVSTAFFNLLNNLEQLKVLKEDTARLGKNLKDTYHQYIGGIVDKTDYKEATITLNTSRAQLRQVKENIRPLYSALKLEMGFAPEKDFSVSFDTLQMVKQIAFDTTQQLQFEKRIEYQLLETSKGLQQKAINYYRTQYLPTLSAFYDFNAEYESNIYSNLFTQFYPYSFVGVSINLPIFAGGQRIESIQRAKMQMQQIELSEVNLKSGIYTQYASALANYKGNLYNLTLLKENVAMAKDVYNVVSLQYKQGIVPYLNVITAESDLISSEISYINALFQVLLSKVDLEKAMGNTQVKR
jgi:outer membrane protein TolC